jgi:hypothetical protein
MWFASGAGVQEVVGNHVELVMARCRGDRRRRGATLGVPILLGVGRCVLVSTLIENGPLGAGRVRRGSFSLSSDIWLHGMVGDQ